MKLGRCIFKESHVLNQKIWESCYSNVIASILLSPLPIPLRSTIHSLVFGYFQFLTTPFYLFGLRNNGETHKIFHNQCKLFFSFSFLNSIIFLVLPGRLSLPLVVGWLVRWFVSFSWNGESNVGFSSPQLPGIYLMTNPQKAFFMEYQFVFHLIYFFSRVQYPIAPI